MAKLFQILAVIGAVLIITLLDNGNPSNSFNKQLQTRSQNALTQISSKLTTSSYQKGNVEFLSDNKKLSESTLQARVKSYSKRHYKKNVPMLVWGDSVSNTATASALGLDWKHHFVSSYLVGIHPFPVENKWLPLYTIAQMKTYQLDSEQYQAVDLWQNSAQAFILPRGDCEDHALILADWLISEGVDAKVVVGTYKDSGHAWVIATVNNQEFLLEPTAKRIRKSWNHFPLASLAKNYHPSFMFNRKYFWANLTKEQTYTGKHWIKTSIFTKAAQSL